MKNYTIYLIRHGLTEGNLQGRYIGRTDLPLCEDGRKRVQEIAERGDYPGMGKIFCSPMLRCRETAVILFPDREIEIADGFKECYFGDFENKSPMELADDTRYTDWIKGGFECSPPNGESNTDFALRCAEAFGEIFVKMTQTGTARAAVVTHAGVIMSLLANCGLPKMKPVQLMLDPAEAFVVQTSTFLWQLSRAVELVGKMKFD
jgi:alpha-ribazole phosphatase